MLMDSSDTEAWFVHIYVPAWTNGDSTRQKGLTTIQVGSDRHSSESFDCQWQALTRVQTYSMAAYATLVPLCPMRESIFRMAWKTNNDC